MLRVDRRQHSYIATPKVRLELPRTNDEVTVAARLCELSRGDPRRGGSASSRGNFSRPSQTTSGQQKTGTYQMRGVVAAALRLRCKPGVGHCTTPRGTTLQPLLLLVLTWLSGLVPCLYVGANSVWYWVVAWLDLCFAP